MSNSTNGGSAADETAGQPNLGVIAQYIKDFSFENPNAPNSLMQPQQQPQIGIQINVNPNQLSNTDFEVELKVEGKAELTGTVLFAFDLNYAGVFQLKPTSRGKSRAAPNDRVSAAAVPVCPRTHRQRDFQRRVPAPDAAADGFRRALSAAPRRHADPAGTDPSLYGSLEAFSLSGGGSACYAHREGRFGRGGLPRVRSVPIVGTPMKPALILKSVRNLRNVVATNINRARDREFIPKSAISLGIETSSLCDLECRFCAYVKKQSPKVSMKDAFFKDRHRAGDRDGVPPVRPDARAPATSPWTAASSTSWASWRATRDVACAISFFTNFTIPKAAGRRDAWSDLGRSSARLADQRLRATIARDLRRDYPS